MRHMPSSPPPKLYRVGEIADHTGLSRQTIHNYTVLGLITEAARTPGNQRLYSDGVFRKLARLERMKETMTLEEIRKALAGRRP